MGHCALCFLVSSLLIVSGCTQWCSAAEQPPIFYQYEVVAELLHDSEAFLQGLEYDQICEAGSNQCQDIFWESTGLYGQSTLRMVDLQTGRVLKSHKLQKQWFGEGLTKMGNKLYQLTWQNPTIFLYDTALRELGSVQSPLKDGWGLTNDGQYLIASDGSTKIHWLKPDTMESVKSVSVHDGDRHIRYINELEYINGTIWANVWFTDCVAQIDPQDGRVMGWLLAHGLTQDLKSRSSQQKYRMDVFNGIAYDSRTARLFVTGKRWPTIFQIKLTLPSQGDPRLQQLRRRCHPR